MHHRRSLHDHVALPEISIDENAPQPYRVFHLMRGVMRAQKQLMMRKLAEKDAHLGQALTLWVLSKHEGASQSDLADMLAVTRPTVTIMLKKMEKAGLVERRPDAHDRRYSRIYLTSAGRALHDELRAVHAQVVSATVGFLSEDDLAELERLLQRVEQGLADATTERRDG